jgi:REP element-mobilizing transposase RayT
MPDHVHMLISIPPKYSVAEVIGYLKGKSSNGTQAAEFSGSQILGESAPTSEIRR